MTECRALHIRMHFQITRATSSNALSHDTRNMFKCTFTWCTLHVRMPFTWHAQHVQMHFHMMHSTCSNAFHMNRATCQNALSHYARNMFKYTVNSNALLHDAHCMFECTFTWRALHVRMYLHMTHATCSDVMSRVTWRALHVQMHFQLTRATSSNAVLHNVHNTFKSTFTLR